MKKIISASILTISALTASAQNPQSGYFNEGYMLRHNMNPAIANTKSYVAIPVLGNLSINQRGNFCAGDILYNRNGETVTFMHPDVTTDEAISSISDHLRFENDMRFDIFSLGIAGKEGKGYTTAGISVRTNTSARMPGQFLRMAKEGPANQSYDFSDFNISTDAFVEIAGGYSRKIDDKLSVGGKVKLLLGFAHIDGQADDTRLTLGEDVWNATVNAQINASVKGLSYINKTEMRGPVGKETPHTHIHDIDLDSPGLNGFGAALDLGATYKVHDMVTVGLSVLDFGFISWSNNMLASTDGPHSVSTDQFTFSFDDKADNSFKDESDRLVDALSDIYELKDFGDQGGRTKMLGATLNVSAEAQMPFYKGLTFGLLNTTRIQGSRSWNETRLSANVTPINWLTFSLNFAAGSFGPTIDYMLSIHPKGFNLFAGLDVVPTSMSKEGVPLRSNFTANFGIMFPF